MVVCGGGVSTHKKSKHKKARRPSLRAHTKHCQVLTERAINTHTCACYDSGRVQCSATNTEGWDHHRGTPCAYAAPSVRAMAIIILMGWVVANVCAVFDRAILCVCKSQHFRVGRNEGLYSFVDRMCLLILHSDCKIYADCHGVYVAPYTHVRLRINPPSQ